MIAGICVGVLLVAWLMRGTGQRESKLNQYDLIRLRLLKEQMQVKENYPFG
jgi:hypothetical protein